MFNKTVLLIVYSGVLEGAVYVSMNVVCECVYRMYVYTVQRFIEMKRSHI